MVTIEQARLVQKKVVDLLNRPSWLGGVSLRSYPTGSFAVCVLVLEGFETKEAAHLPAMLDGVPIVIEQVGRISPL